MTDSKPAMSSTERIASALDANVDGLVCQWIMVASVVNPDGQRLLHTYYQPGQATWETLGLLAQATLQTQRKAG